MADRNLIKKIMKRRILEYYENGPDFLHLKQVPKENSSTGAETTLKLALGFRNKEPFISDIEKLVRGVPRATLNAILSEAEKEFRLPVPTQALITKHIIGEIISEMGKINFAERFDPERKVGEDDRASFIEEIIHSGKNKKLNSMFTNRENFVPEIRFVAEKIAAHKSFKKEFNRMLREHRTQRG
jgi:hypothetical protein